MLRSLNPRKNTVFARHNGQLALFHKVTDHLDYWGDHWNEAKCAALIERGRRGELPEFGEAILQHAPPHLPVLEAGCGPGHIVAALQARGYQAMGIDYEPRVIEFARKAAPDLTVFRADIRHLPYADGGIGAYISIGLIEHFEDGCVEALAEIRRALHDDGFAFISVPYLNPARKAMLGRLSAAPTTGLHFYQYYFSREELAAPLERAGLKIVEFLPYAAEAFLTREHALTARFWRSPLARERLKRPVRRIAATGPRWFKAKYAHMLMAVCRPDVSAEGRV